MIAAPQVTSPTRDHQHGRTAQPHETKFPRAQSDRDRQAFGFARPDSVSCRHFNGFPVPGMQSAWKNKTDTAFRLVVSRVMAWRSHGTSNDDLLDQLKRTYYWRSSHHHLKAKERLLRAVRDKTRTFSAGNGVLKSQRVEAALRRVDRKQYSKLRPYQDTPQPIGEFTVSSRRATKHLQHCLQLCRSVLSFSSKAFKRRSVLRIW